jgi:hypothetical protein
MASPKKGKRKILPSAVVKAGKKISKDRYVRLDSEEARIMKEFYYNILSEEPLLKKKWEEVNRLAHKHWGEKKSLREIAKEENNLHHRLAEMMKSVGIPVMTQSESAKLKFAKMSPEDKEVLSNKMSKMAKNLWGKMSPEDKEAWAQKKREDWEKMSPEDKEVHAQKTRKRWEKMSPAERETHIQKQKEGWEKIFA